MRGSDSLFGGNWKRHTERCRQAGKQDVLDGGTGNDIVDYSDARGKQVIFFDPAEETPGRTVQRYLGIHRRGHGRHATTATSLSAQTTDDRIIGGNKNDGFAWPSDGMDVLEGRDGKDELTAAPALTS